VLLDAVDPLLTMLEGSQRLDVLHIDRIDAAFQQIARLVRQLALVGLYERPICPASSSA
jgi:hypothetical protein